MGDKSRTQLLENKNVEKFVPSLVRTDNKAISLRPKDDEVLSRTVSPTAKEKNRLGVGNSTCIPWSKDQMGYKARPTKTNRAFMLRQQLNTKNNGYDLTVTRNKVMNSEETLDCGISRFAVGRHSARKAKGKHQKSHS